MGNDFLKEKNIPNAPLVRGSFGSLRQYANKSIDVIFTDAAMIYLNDNQAFAVVNEMIRVAKRLSS